MLDVIHKPKACPKVDFCANPKTASDDKNPISKAGERANLLKATAGGGLLFGGRILLWLTEEGFEWESLFRLGKKISDKNNPNAKGYKKDLLHIGAFGAVLVGFVAAVAAIYTLYNTPKALYHGKVNAFVKGKDMDVYQKSNVVEKELYNQMVAKAKNATPEEKAVLAQQYLKLKAAKNQVPDSVRKQ